MIGRLPKAEIIANFGVGYDSVDAAEAARRGIIVTNTPNVLNEEVADIAMGLLIATARQLPQADRYLREGRWLKAAYPPHAGHAARRKLGIVGLGRIGKAIAKRAEAFGLTISYFGRNRQADVAHSYHPTLVGLAEAVDTLMIIVPGGPETRGMVDAKVLEALGPSGILVNVARGTVVDDDALIAALRDGTILAAGLDVFADEPNVPKALSRPRQRRAAAACRLGVRAYAAGHGSARRRQPPVVEGRQGADHAGAGDALAAAIGLAGDRAGAGHRQRSAAGLASGLIVRQIAGGRHGERAGRLHRGRADGPRHGQEHRREGLSA